MTTVAALIDRTYRQILEPPDAQPASSRLASAIDDTLDTFSLKTFDIPEDENLVRLGSIIEIGQELMRVVDFVPTTRAVTVLRGYLGTEKAAHVEDDQVKLSPPYPRMDVFNAITENIVALYPDLWTVRTTVIAPAGDDVYPIADSLTVEVVELNPSDSPFGTVNIPARIVDNHPRVGGRALVVNGSATGQLWLRYRRRFALAADETALLADLGVETVWNTMVMVGAAADMMSGRDVQAVQTEWVQNALQSENIRVGTRLSVAGGLAQYRDILMARFMKEMRGEDSNRIRVHQREVFA
jgi:hypothetical protein